MKTLLVKAVEDSASPLVALLVRGDHELNEVKAEKLPQVASPLTFATEEEIRALVNAGPGSLGPVNMPVPVIIDRTVAVMSDCRWRQYRWQTLLRHQLGPRCRDAGSGRHP